MLMFLRIFIISALKFENRPKKMFRSRRGKELSIYRNPQRREKKFFNIEETIQS